MQQVAIWPPRAEGEQVSKYVPCPILRRPSYVCTVRHVGTRNTTSYTVWKAILYLCVKPTENKNDRNNVECFIWDESGETVVSFFSPQCPPYRQSPGNSTMAIVWCGSMMTVCVRVCSCTSNIFLTGRTRSLPLAGANLTHTTCCAIACCQNHRALALRCGLHAYGNGNGNSLHHSRWHRDGVLQRWVTGF